ncbi:hypothetical protein B0H15DRAFT_177395 [Mycena belliarum]|uniref:Uncharacterized protein n=1 Tax=Mycena belliarum TaxID=1033014 RepID=A0AAD6TMW2_9AGAR|nr:hypothetical protein B0H15DRAFT_177395 [Mycena belliae]
MHCTHLLPMNWPRSSSGTSQRQSVFPTAIRSYCPASCSSACYDKHIDDKLSLCYVKPMASLANDIASVASHYFESVSGRGLLLACPSESIKQTARPTEAATVVDATDVSTFYDRNTSTLFLAVATKLFLLPKPPGHTSIVFFGVDTEQWRGASDPWLSTKITAWQ